MNRSSGTSGCNDATDGRLLFDGREIKRRSSLHEILGGGIAADVILWRRKDVTIGILVGAVGTYVVFQHSGQTLLSFLSKVALLLTSILFLWAKAATVLRRQLPSLPDLSISEESLGAVATSLLFHINSLLATARAIALGKETHLFLLTTASLWLISIIGSFMDFVTFCCTCFVVGLTIPALYERYEYRIEQGVLSVKRVYERLEAAYGNIVRTGVPHGRKQC